MLELLLGDFSYNPKVDPRCSPTFDKSLLNADKLICLHGLNNLSKGKLTPNQLINVIEFLRKEADDLQEKRFTQIANALNTRIKYIKFLDSSWGFFSYFFQRKNKGELNTEREYLRAFLKIVCTQLKAVEGTKALEFCGSSLFDESPESLAQYHEMVRVRVTKLAEKALPNLPLPRDDKSIAKKEVTGANPIGAKPEKGTEKPQKEHISSAGHLGTPTDRVEPTKKQPVADTTHPTPEKSVEPTDASGIPEAPPAPNFGNEVDGVPDAPDAPSDEVPNAPKLDGETSTAPEAPTVNKEVEKPKVVKLKNEPVLPLGVKLVAMSLRDFLEKDDKNRGLLIAYRDEMNKLLAPYIVEQTKREQAVEGYKKRMESAKTRMKDLKENLSKLIKLTKEAEDHQKKKEIFTLNVPVLTKMDVPLVPDEQLNEINAKLKAEGIKPIEPIYTLSKFIDSLRRNKQEIENKIKELTDTLNDAEEQKRIQDLVAGILRSEIDPTLTLAEVQTLVTKRNQEVELIERILKSKPAKPVKEKETPPKESREAALSTGARAHFEMVSRRPSASPIKGFSAAQQKFGLVDPIKEREIQVLNDLIEKKLSDKNG